MDFFRHANGVTHLIRSKINCTCSECNKRKTKLDSMTFLLQRHGLWAETISDVDFYERFKHLNPSIVCDLSKAKELIAKCISASVDNVKFLADSDTLSCEYSTHLKGVQIFYKVNAFVCNFDVIRAHLLDPLVLALNNMCTSGPHGERMHETTPELNSANSLEETCAKGQHLNKEAFERFVEASHRLFVLPPEAVSATESSNDSCSTLEQPTSQKQVETEEEKELRRKLALQRKIERESQKLKATPPKKRCLF
uniref:Cilia-and flagella-associated protein 20 n=1 Tax=Schistocephalus solidus TaxID=70667 RepID=A0A0X3Q1R8_SCHSO